MTLIELRVSLDITGHACTPEVRAFIDLEPEIGLDTEMELPLRQVAGPEWVGCFTLGPTRPGRFLYRLGLAAQAGVDWSLSVRHRRLRRDILSDGDTLATAKCWLVGSCCVPSSEDRRVAGMSARDVGVAAALPPSPTANTGDRDSQPGVVFLDRYRPHR